MMKKLITIGMLILLAGLLSGCAEKNASDYKTKSYNLYCGDFDYATNDTIFFANETGRKLYLYSDQIATPMEKEIDEQRNIVTKVFDSVTLFGYNFTKINDINPKCVNVYVDYYVELYAIQLTFYDKSPEIYYANEFENLGVW